MSWRIGKGFEWVGHNNTVKEDQVLSLTVFWEIKNKDRYKELFTIILLPSVQWIRVDDRYLFNKVWGKMEYRNEDGLDYHINNKMNTWSVKRSIICICLFIILFYEQESLQCKFYLSICVTVLLLFNFLYSFPI